MCVLLNYDTCTLGSTDFYWSIPLTAYFHVIFSRNWPQKVHLHQSDGSWNVGLLQMAWWKPCTAVLVSASKFASVHIRPIMAPVPYKSEGTSSLSVVSDLSRFWDAIVLGREYIVLRSSMRKVFRARIYIHYWDKTLVVVQNK